MPAKKDASAETKDLTITNPEDQFAILKIDKEEMGELIQENLGGEAIDPNEFDKVVVPSQGMTIWTVPTIDGEVNTKEIVGIIVHTQITRAYWEKSYDDGGAGTPPDCKSADGLEGIGDPGGTCISCPKNMFPEDIGQESEKPGKPCSESRLLFMVLKDETLPIVIKVPTMSLKNARKYLRGLTSKRQFIHSVYTRLTLEKDKNKKDIAYSKIVFEKAGDVEMPELSKAYAKNIKPILQQAANQMVDQRDYVENED